MYVVSCPNCAHPCPVSLDRPDAATCPACGFAGALPPDLRGRLEAAAGLLKGIDVRHRQLTGQQRSVLGSGCGFTVILATVVTVFMIPAIIWAAVNVGLALEARTLGNTVLSLVLGLSPALVLLLGATVSYLLLRRVRDRLKRATVAAPPFEGSTAARCRVCSAELVSTGDAIVRCAFCEADNIVDSSIVSDAAQAQYQVLEGFERVVSDAGQSLHRAARHGVVAVIASLASAPVLAFLFAMIAYAALSAVEQPANLELRYTILDTPGGRCLARVYESGDGSFELSFGVATPPGASTTSRRTTLEGLEIVNAQWVVGRDVRSHYFSTPSTGRVTAIVGDLTGETNFTTLQGWSVPIEGLCLVTPE